MPRNSICPASFSSSILASGHTCIWRRSRRRWTYEWTFVSVERMLRLSRPVFEGEVQQSRTIQVIRSFKPFGNLPSTTSSSTSVGCSTAFGPAYCTCTSLWWKASFLATQAAGPTRRTAPLVSAHRRASGRAGTFPPQLSQRRQRLWRSS